MAQFPVTSTINHYRDRWFLRIKHEFHFIENQ